MQNVIKLGLIDDHPLHIDGMKLIFNNLKGYRILASALNGLDGLKILIEYQINVLLLDIHLPDIKINDLIIKIKENHPTIKIVIFSHQKGSRYLNNLTTLGISGYVLKSESLEILLEAIQKVNNGESYFSKGILETKATEEKFIVNSIANDKQTVFNLSNQEKTILNLVCQEMSSSEIAKKLFISISTVDTHRKNILIKTGTTNTVGLVKFALKNDLFFQ